MPKTLAASEMSLGASLLPMSSTQEDTTDVNKISEIFQESSSLGDIEPEILEEQDVELEEIIEEISSETPSTEGAAGGDSDEQGASGEDLKVHEDHE